MCINFLASSWHILVNLNKMKKWRQKKKKKTKLSFYICILWRWGTRHRLNDVNRGTGFAYILYPTHEKSEHVLLCLTPSISLVLLMLLKAFSSFKTLYITTYFIINSTLLFCIASRVIRDVSIGSLPSEGSRARRHSLLGVFDRHPGRSRSTDSY